MVLKDVIYVLSGNSSFEESHGKRELRSVSICGEISMNFRGLMILGDGIVSMPEICDDGNNLNNDNCSAGNTYRNFTEISSS